MRRPLAIRFAVFAGIVGLSVSASLVLPSGVHPMARSAGHREAESAPGDDYLNARLTTGNHLLADDAFTAAGQQAQQIIQQSALQDPSDANALWVSQGPTNIDGNNNDGGGRIPDLAVDPNHAGTVYVATAGGGVWKTTDAGANFTSVWPNSYPQAIGAVAVGSDGTVWVGTGETNPGGGSITFFGDGIYRSTDGGASWTNVGLNDSWTIARIVVNPTNANQIWVAVSGNLFLAGHQRGVYVSNDHGTTWTQSLSAPNGTTGASDLAISIQNPGTLYAGMWDHVRVPDHRTYSGIGSGVWKTTNSGTTWTELTSAANALLDGLPPDNQANGRTGLAVAPSNDQDVYVNYANDPNGVNQGFFVSTNGASSFTLALGTSDLDTDPTSSSYVYGWWFAKTFVDPVNPAHVFVTGLCLWESTNSASSFSSNCGVHADQHAMAWDPHVANQVFLGDDGGFYTSTSNGAAGSWHPAAYQPWPQFAGLDVSEQDPTRIIGGLQDNGSQRSWNNSGATVAQNQWNSTFGGDGQQNLINPQNQQIVYSCLQYGVCQVSTDGGNTGNEFDTTPLSINQNCTNCTHTARNVYFTPMAFEPSNPSTVYYAGDVVNVSDDNGSTWRQISTNLGGPSPGTETDPLYAGHYGAVTTISVSSADPNSVWVGTDSGLVWMTSDAKNTATMPTWTQVSGLPTRWVSKILACPSSATIRYVAFSGYRSGDNLPYIERTNDGGATWTDLSSNLPEATVNDLTLVNNRLYAATDTGVYVSDPAADPVNGAAFTWRQLGSNLPNNAATALRYIPTNSTLYVSTFGRGVWSLALTPGPDTSVPEAGSPLLLPLGAMGLVGLAGVALRRRRRSTALS